MKKDQDSPRRLDSLHPLRLKVYSWRAVEPLMFWIPLQMPSIRAWTAQNVIDIVY
jgi:hypothetical protein